MKRKTIFTIIFLALSWPMFAQFIGGAGDGYASQMLENKMPVSESINYTLPERGDYWFSEADFSFSDEDGYFSGIKIVALESKGDLEFLGVNVLENEIISDVTQLQFKTLNNDYGWPYAVFSFKVLDNEGGLSLANYTCTFYVIHNPLGQSSYDNVNEDDTLRLSSANFSMTFGDSRSYESIVIKNLPSFGKLQYDELDAVVNLDYIDPNLFSYIPEKDSNGVDYDYFGYQIKDNAQYVSDSVYSLNITVNPMPDAPTGGNIEITLDEDSIYVFSATEFPFEDIDFDQFAGIQITNISQVGTVKYQNTPVLNNDTILNLSELVFYPLPNGFGTNYDNFFFKVLDSTIHLGEFTYKCNINVLAVSDAPLSGDTSVSILEDQNYTFKTQDFIFSDIDNESLVGMLIETVPDKGSLKYNNAAVSPGSYITVFNLLSYTPVADEFGQNYTWFNFKLKDGGGDFSESHKFSINVESQNDLPTCESYIKNIYEDIPYYFNNDDLKFSDGDIGDTLYGLYFTALPEKGTLKIGEELVEQYQIYSPIDSVSYTNILNEYAANYAVIYFKVVDSEMGISENIYDLVLHVNASPDFPVGSDFEITIYEDSLQNFEYQTIPFSDPDGQTFGGLRIDSLPLEGQLFYEGNAVSVGNYCTDMSQLIYSAPKDSFANALTYFFASVLDPTLLSSEMSYKAEINVLPVNDAPFGIELSENHISENKAIGSTIGYLTAQDIDSEYFSFLLDESSDLSDIDNKYFKVEGSALITNVELDFEMQYLYFIRLAAYDDENAKISAGFVIYIDDEVENGIENYASQLKLYPNPALNYILLDGDFKDLVYYRITNIKGFETSSMEILLDSRISVSHLIPGYYILEIISGQEIIRQMFIKN